MGFITIEGTERIAKECPNCKSDSYVEAMRALEPEQKGKKKDAAKNIGGGFDRDLVSSGPLEGFNLSVARNNTEKVQRAAVSKDGRMVVEWQETWCGSCGTRYVRTCHLAWSA